MGKPLRIKPHHAEGAQRYISFGKNESHKEMLEGLTDAVAADPDAELVFVRGFDEFCEKKCIRKGEDPPCDVAYGSASIVTGMDEEVAREHGWEFDKLYQVREILNELRAEAPDREIFYICQLTREEYERWLKDIRASKERKKQKRIHFPEVLAQYEGRKPSPAEQPEAEKLNFNKRDVQQKMDEAASGVLQKYREIKKESPGIVVDKPDVWKKLMPIEAVIVDETIPLTLFVQKSFFREGETGEETTRISFNLVKGKLEAEGQEALFNEWRSSIRDGNLISTLEFIDKGTVFDMKDRETNPKYREQGFAGMLLRASESFIQKDATDSEGARVAYVDTAQLDVISWLYNRGYRTQTPDDSQRLAEVLAGNKDIALGDKYYVFKDVPEDERTKKTAYRIKLVKDISP